MNYYTFNLIRHFIKTSLMILIILFYSCNNQKDYLQEALKLAGENRHELEKVLVHYENDSLKLEAAKFLIENMPGHYSYAENNDLTNYCNEIDSLHEATIALPRAERLQLYNTISSKYDTLDLKRIPDLHIVTADYLIKNIDLSFDLWKHGEWALHLSFDDFCEYLLPYKIIDGQILDDWKDYSQEICRNNIDSLPKFYTMNI